MQKGCLHVNKESARWIKKLWLQKHPEGGYFEEIYRSDLTVNIGGYDGPRHISTAIYYMLVGNQFSAFHRIKSDETWHHYAGGSLILYAIINSKLLKIKIGKGKDELPQFMIKANTWFAASLYDRRSYCLLGCTVSPGFDYRDWELGRHDELVMMHPHHKKIIEQYTII
jgi:predicted cupin superfamily sugar epimerase